MDLQSWNTIQNMDTWPLLIKMERLSLYTRLPLSVCPSTKQFNSPLSGMEPHLQSALLCQRILILLYLLLDYLAKLLSLRKISCPCCSPGSNSNALLKISNPAPPPILKAKERRNQRFALLIMHEMKFLCLFTPYFRV